jgi:hypothetical protein
MDKLELWLMTFVFYFIKVAPYIVVAALMNLIIQLIIFIY